MLSVITNWMGDRGGHKIGIPLTHITFGSSELAWGPVGCPQTTGGTMFLVLVGD